MLFIEKLPTRYSSGLASVTAGQKTVTPTNAAWLGNAWGDDLFFLPSQPLVPPQRIEAVNDDGTLTLAVEWPGTTETEVPYEIRYVGIIERSTAQTRAVLEQLGDVKAYYDVQVDTLADRAGFDSRPAGYRVLVSNIGDGRAAIYSKASSADGDWTAAAMFSGPVGPIAEVTVSGTTTLAPGSAAEVTPTPTPEGVSLAFGIPAGRGATPRGTYNPATAYVLDDAVLDNGSTWIALQSTTGNAPPVLPTTSNEWWQLLARAGQDGTGTIATLVAGDGISIDNTDPTAPIISAEASGVTDGNKGDVVVSDSGMVWTTPDFAGDSGSGGTKGAVPAPAAGDALADKVLGANGGWIPRRNSASAVYTVNENLSTTIPYDDTIPQSTEGTQVVSVEFAASTSAAKVRVTFTAWGQHNTSDNGLVAAFFLDSETSARRVMAVNPPTGLLAPLVLVYEFSPGDTSSHTYRIRVGATGGVMRLNGSASGRSFGGTSAATLTVDEV